MIDCCPCHRNLSHGSASTPDPQAPYPHLPLRRERYSGTKFRNPEIQGPNPETAPLFPGAPKTFSGPPVPRTSLEYRARVPGTRPPAPSRAVVREGAQPSPEHEERSPRQREKDRPDPFAREHNIGAQPSQRLSARGPAWPPRGAARSPAGWRSTLRRRPPRGRGTVSGEKETRPKDY